MKIILGCAAAATLSLFGAPQAAADVNIGGINFGSQGNAEASFGNVAIATQRSAHAVAVGGVGNWAIASGAGDAAKTGPGNFNTAYAGGDGGQTEITGNSNFNITGSFNGGHTTVNNSNAIISWAGRSANSTAAEANSSVVTAYCGGSSSVSAQSARIKVSAPCVGAE